MLRPLHINKLTQTAAPAHLCLNDSINIISVNVSRSITNVFILCSKKLSNHKDSDTLQAHVQVRPYRNATMNNKN